MKTIAIPQATKKGYIECREGGVFDATYPTSKYRRGRVQGDYGDIAPTLTSTGSEGLFLITKIMETKTPRPEGKGWVYDKVNERWFRVRKLMARECFRLMGLRDCEIDKLMATRTNPKNGKVEQIISNSQLYKMAGNSIVVDVMEYGYENLFFPKPKEYREGEQLSLFQ